MSSSTLHPDVDSLIIKLVYNKVNVPVRDITPLSHMLFSFHLVHGDIL